MTAQQSSSLAGESLAGNALTNNALVNNSIQKITLCATARLSHGAQKYHQSMLAKQHSVWQTPQIATLSQWLANFCEHCLLSNEPATSQLPHLSLNNSVEKMLWQQAIEKSLQKNALQALFDTASLADSAIEAHQLLTHWQVTDSQINGHFQSIETRQFLRWRRQFQALCAKYQALDAAQLLVVQIDIIKNSQLPLPNTIELLGFDRLTPLMQLLLAVLQAKGVHIINQHISITQGNQQTHVQVLCQQLSFADMNTECRAAVAWAQAKIAQNPNAQLAIITPVLGNIRRVLADLLDDTFHPETLNPAAVEQPRVYDFSIGLRLSEHLLSQCAFKILRLSCAKLVLPQADFSALLLDIAWSNDHEMDLRCQFDAYMRKNCARHLSLRSLIQHAEYFAPNSQIVQHLQALQSIQQQWRSNSKQLPSVWAQLFMGLLNNLNWAPMNALSSHQYQAYVAWLENLQNLSQLDALLGKINANAALQHLTQLCANHMFLPETKNTPNIQILGMLETSAIPLDGAWILGINEQHWPPPARPNALLPFTLQRDLKIPNASANIQTAFALNIQQRLESCANEVIFSWAEKESDRELRASPLLSKLAFASNTFTLAATMAEKLALPQTLDLIDDNLAPAINESEVLRGGSQLFAAQAICPAWAFYQYRLGAKALETPTDGLDSLERGNLVHAALQHFWLQCSNLNTLKAQSNNALQHNIKQACQLALQQFDSQYLPIRIVEIEQLRLQNLLNNWLALEMQRDDFSVQYCERDVLLSIQGLSVKLRIDRVDALADGTLVVIDYKTGSTTQSHIDWANKRLKNPQLPLYAALALQDVPVAATCFAKVHNDECKLTGVSSQALLEICAFDDLQANSVFKQFIDMQMLIAHWRTCLNAIAIEIKNGVADVRFEKESDLLYCDVKPLLRLPEREWQFEQQNATN